MSPEKKEFEVSIPSLKKKAGGKRAMFHPKRNIMIIVLLLVAAVGGRIIANRRAAQGGGNRERVTTVLVRTAEKSSLKRFLDLYADLKAENEVEITSPVSGKVLNLSRLEGAGIARGQTVMTVDRFEVGVRYAPASVQSPVSGVVTRILVNEGEDVTAGKAVATVGNPNRIEAVIKVPESFANEVRVGQEVFFQSRSIPDETFRGLITRRDLSLDPKSRSLTVRASISNTGALFSGIFAESYIYVEEATNVYVVPDSALTKTRDGQDAIYISKDDKADLRPVTIALRYRDQVAISDGVEDGEQMVIFGREYLSPGVPVRPIAETETNQSEQLLVQTNG